jgi:TonB family protein
VPMRAPRMFSTDLGAAPLPARGLFYSLLAHALFAVAALALPWSYWIPSQVHLVTEQSQVREQEALLLPNLQPMGGGSPAAPSRGGGHGNPKKNEASPAASGEAKAVKGVVYKGPQLIVSNPPHPDNFIQTIRQPDLPVKMKLRAPLPIPPMVSIAPVKPVLAPAPPLETPHEAPPVEAVLTPPLSLSQQLPKVDAPKLPLPAASAEDSPLRKVADAPVLAPMPKLAPPPAPPAMAATGAHNILVVDALPSPNPKPSAIPPGELNGAFTVSPTGSTSLGLAGGGTASKGAPGVGSATGVGTGPYAGTGNSAGGSGEGKGALAGTGAGTGVGTGVGNGNGNGAGGKGAGNGSGTGTGHGSGSGRADTGTGTSPFPSIMIQGGSGGSGRSTRAASPAAGKPQVSYGITIVASGASGGGFKDYGIFTDGASYTVYLDMSDVGLQGSSWAMQYALDSHAAPDSSDPPPPAHGILEPPYALTKSLPHVSPAAARRSRGGTIVVSGVLNPNGQWEGLRIMQSPDSGLNAVVLEALRRWTFKPAELNGSPVYVKCLLGVLVNSLPVD